MQKADIGLIGLAVMGENLVINMASKGFTVAVFNRTVERERTSLASTPLRRCAHNSKNPAA